MKAIFNNQTIAKSDNTKHVEGYDYFPRESVIMNYLEVSEKTYECPIKGHADYFHVLVNGARAENVAWSYTKPSSAGEHIRDYIAFQSPVEII